MTPSELGYGPCKTCGHERPIQSIGPLGSCNDWGRCIDQQVENVTRAAHEAIHRENVLGWDANGSPAPTGIDENGDAA